MTRDQFEDKLEKMEALQTILEFAALAIGIIGLLGFAKLVETEVADAFVKYCIELVYLSTWAGMLLSAIIGAISANKTWNLMNDSGSISAASATPSWDEMACYSLAIVVILCTFWLIQPGFTMGDYVQGQFELMGMLLFGFIAAVLCYIAGGMRQNKRLAKSHVASAN